MKKEQFDQAFEQAFENAVRQSFLAIRSPTAAEIRSSWQLLHHKREASFASRTDASIMPSTEEKRENEGGYTYESTAG